jgi:hypothetical protein
MRYQDGWIVRYLHKYELNQRSNVSYSLCHLSLIGSMDVKEGYDWMIRKLSTAASLELRG